MSYNGRDSQKQDLKDLDCGSVVGFPPPVAGGAGSRHLAPSSSMTMMVLVTDGASRHSRREVRATAVVVLADELEAPMSGPLYVCLFFVEVWRENRSAMLGSSEVGRSRHGRHRNPF
jgi:hypothetical protein